MTSRSLNEYHFSKAQLFNTNKQDSKKNQKSTITSLFSGFSNSIFSNPYILSFVVIIITSLVGKYQYVFKIKFIKKKKRYNYVFYFLFAVYCYGFSFNSKYIPLFKSKFKYYFILTLSCIKILTLDVLH